LIGPSGAARLVDLDRNGSATLVLARGNYAAQVQAAGMAPFATIALSRSQTVIVPVITPLDMFVVATAFLLVVAALFATGRGRRLVFSLIRAPAWRQGTWDRPQLTLGAAVPWVVSYPTPNLVVALDAEPAVAAEVVAQPRFASRMVATFPSGCILTGPADAERA